MATYHSASLSLFILFLATTLIRTAATSTSPLIASPPPPPPPPPPFQLSPLAKRLEDVIAEPPLGFYDFTSRIPKIAPVSLTGNDVQASASASPRPSPQDLDEFTEATIDFGRFAHVITIGDHLSRATVSLSANDAVSRLLASAPPSPPSLLPASPLAATASQQNVQHVTEAPIDSGSFVQVIAVGTQLSLPQSMTVFHSGNDEVPATNEFLSPDHVVPQRLTFADLILLETGSRLPTLLPGRFITITNNTAANYTVNNRQIIHPNAFVTRATAFLKTNYAVARMASGSLPPAMKSTLRKVEDIVEAEISFGSLDNLISVMNPLSLPQSTSFVDSENDSVLRVSGHPSPLSSNDESDATATEGPKFCP